MIAHRAALASLGAFFVVACADLVGIRELPSSSDAAPSDGQAADGADVSQSDAGGTCTSARMVIAPTIALDSVSVSQGFVFARESATSGIVRCATSATCTAPANIAQAASQGVLAAYGAGTTLFYTLQSTVPTSGSLHTASLDGTSDTTPLSNLTYPSWTTVCGTRAFWIDDPITGGLGGSASLHCYNCSNNGLDQLWTTQLKATSAVLADVNNVYVLAYDSTNTTLGVYGCSTATSCGTSPRTVVTGLATSTTRAMIATDGFDLYAARPDKFDIERFDASNQMTVIVPAGVNAVALAVDISTHDLFYATDQGQIVRTPLDGSPGGVPFSTCDSGVQISELTLDAANLYVTVTFGNASTGVFAIAR